MARLPKPGGDAGNWGEVLNEFLSVEHQSDGTLNPSGTLSKKYTKPDDGIPKADLETTVQADISQIPTLSDKADAIAAPGWVTRTRLAPDVAAAVEQSDTRVFDPRRYGAACDGVTDDTSALTATVNAMRVANSNALGEPIGHLVIPRKTRIGTAWVIDMGYGNVRFTGGGVGASSKGPQFRITTDAPLVCDAGLGNSVTIKNGYGPILDLQFEGGGGVGDNALHLENILSLELRTLSGNAYAGTLLHMDGTAGTNKRVSQATVGYIYASRCGRAIYAKGIEGFERIDRVWDTSILGSVFDTCADVGIGHWENFTDTTMTYGIDFVNCNSFNVSAISMGDRASSAMMRIMGGDFGRINQLRVSGKPDGTYTGDGLRLEEVTSVEIDTLHTFRNGGAGCRIVGGGGNGIRIKRHVSMTTDGTPLAIEAGTGTAPRVRVTADYRYHKGASVTVGTGFTGGIIKIDGYLEDMWTSGPTGKYAVDCQSGAVNLDLRGLISKARSGLAGYVNPAASGLIGVSKVVGVTGLISFQDPVPDSSSLLTQQVVANTTTNTPILEMPILGGTTKSGDTYRVTVWGSVDNLAASKVTLYFGIGGGPSWYQDVTNASALSGKKFFLTGSFTFRPYTGSVFPVFAGGMIQSDTLSALVASGTLITRSFSMASTDVVRVSAAWSVADAGNVLKVEGCVIEKVK